MQDKCPGAANVRTPTLEIKKCPECGGEVEIFSTDRRVLCPGCGYVIYGDIESCVRWCKYARECVGTELYERLNRQLSEEIRGLTGE